MSFRNSFRVGVELERTKAASGSCGQAERGDDMQEQRSQNACARLLAPLISAAMITEQLCRSGRPQVVLMMMSKDVVVCQSVHVSA